MNMPSNCTVLSVHATSFAQSVHCPARTAEAATCPMRRLYIHTVDPNCAHTDERCADECVPRTDDSGASAAPRARARSLAHV